MTKPQDPVKVAPAVQSVAINDMYHTIDGYDFIYENVKATKIDVVRPGFFNPYRDDRNLKCGNVIECRLGKVEDGITQVWLQVIEVRARALGGDVIVAVGPSRKFTPCRHDGEQEKPASETDAKKEEIAA